MEAKQLIESVKTLYAKSLTYSDEGFLITPDKAFVPFKTFFMRPDCFRYECDRESPTQYLVTPRQKTILWCRGKWLYDHPLLGPIANESSTLGNAIARAVSFARTAPIHTTSLLLGLPDNFIATDTSARTLLDEEDCYVLSSSHDGVGLTVWISCDQLVLRRVKYSHEMSETHLHESLMDLTHSLQQKGLDVESFFKKDQVANKYTFDFCYRSVKLNQPIAEAVFASI